MNALAAAAVAVPTVLIVMSATGGATAQITHSVARVRDVTHFTGAALVAASMVAGNTGVFLTTVLAVGAVLFATSKLWSESDCGCQ